MLYEFLRDNRDEILALTERKSRALTGVRPSSEQLKQGLPIFLNQLMAILKLESAAVLQAEIDAAGMVKASNENDEPGLAKAAGRLGDAAVARAAGMHGAELLRLGYTLSHVVHAYGSICQSITGLATEKKAVITASEFRDLNMTLDVAIAGAVTEYQSLRNTETRKSFGVTAHFIDGETFDSGKIIKVLSFPMNPATETVISLEQKTQVKLVQLFKIVIDAFSKNKRIKLKLNSGGLYLTSGQLDELKRVDLSKEPLEELHRKIRAFFFPPHTGAYIEIKGERFTLIDQAMLDLIAKLLTQK
jgi:hypothetical protein